MQRGLAANGWMQVLSALQHGILNIGANYWGAPIGTYSTLAVMIVATPFGIFLAFRYWR